MTCNKHNIYYNANTEHCPACVPVLAGEGGAAASGAMLWTYEEIDGKHGVFEGNLLVAVVGECVTRRKYAVAFAEEIVTAHNSFAAMREALKKALTCASLNSDVRTLIIAALAAKGGE